MKKQCFCNFMLAGISLTDYGLSIPSPFCSLSLSNSQITSFTSWTLSVTVGGDASRKMNIAAFDALLYSAAQDSAKYANSSGIPVSFMFGWLDDRGNVSEYVSYQGFTLKFSVSTSGMFMTYNVTGYASLALKSAMPVLNIPALSGYVQPSAVLIGLAKALKADQYYDLDIDRNDAPTLVSHGAQTTSLTAYVRGTQTGEDDYTSFPGLLPLSKSYNATRDSAGLINGIESLTQLSNVSPENIAKYLKMGMNDATPQCSSFVFWIDEPTMTKKGVIHYKSQAGLAEYNSSTLTYGTKDSNILSISGSYDGVAYNMTDMNFSALGFTLDGSGNTVVNDANVVNSWSNSLADVFQTANIVNDINALASQFSGKFNVTIAGSTKEYTVAQPVSLIIMSGNTLSPVSGVYSITEVTHSISTTFVTSLTLQRLVMSSANQTAISAGIFVSGSGNYNQSYEQTSNVVSTSKVNFGTLYPTFEDITTQ